MLWKMDWQGSFFYFLTYFSSIQNLKHLQIRYFRKPPMGWMSWTRFLCEINCQSFPNACINERLYQEQADRLVQDGYLGVGYNTASFILIENFL